jgi:hypothetical protein
LIMEGVLGYVQVGREEQNGCARASANMACESQTLVKLAEDGLPIRGFRLGALHYTLMSSIQSSQFYRYIPSVSAPNTDLGHETCLQSSQGGKITRVRGLSNLHHNYQAA